MLGDAEQEAEGGGGEESNERDDEGDGALRDAWIRLLAHALRCTSKQAREWSMSA